MNITGTYLNFSRFFNDSLIQGSCELHLNTDIPMKKHVWSYFQIQIILYDAQYAVKMFILKFIIKYQIASF